MERRIPDDARAARSDLRERWFKRAIILTTAVVSAILISTSAPARFHLLNGLEWIRAEVVRRVTGLEPDRDRIEAEWARKRAFGIQQTHRVLRRFFDETTDEMRALFQVAAMDPDHGLVRYGRGDQAFLVSSQVFEPDSQGRSYRMLPNTRSVWLRQVTLHNGPFGLFQVPDTPEVRAAAVRAGAIVDEGSAQSTNSWGLRGPEPDPDASIRGVVLGDSFMQAMFNGDDETPSVYLARRLEERWERSVSIANTGHIGYSPEQYYYSLVEYGDRMKAQFVVVSVCPNDFGEGYPVLLGKGDWFDEAAYWLGRIHGWCRARSAALLVVAVPTHIQVEDDRKDAFYPGQVCNIFRAAPSQYYDPLDEFINENLSLKRDAFRKGKPYNLSKLFNREIRDDHFSPLGADLWAKLVARRLTLILETQSFGLAPEEARPATTAPSIDADRE